MSRVFVLFYKNYFIGRKISFDERGSAKPGNILGQDPAAKNSSWRSASREVQ